MKIKMMEKTFAVTFLVYVSVFMSYISAQNDHQSTPEEIKPETFRTEERPLARRIKKFRPEAVNDPQKMQKIRNFFNQFSEEEIERFQEIHREKPEKLRNEIENLISDKRKQIEEENKKIDSLAEEYRKNEDPDKKNELKNQLRAILKEQFNNKMQINKKRIAQAEEKLSDLKKRLEQRQINAEKIIEDRLNEITKDLNMVW